MQDRQDQRAMDAQKSDSGQPGGGQGRTDDAPRTGIYRMSDQNAPEDADTMAEGELGQSERGMQGYNDSGSSETRTMPPSH